MLRRAPTSISLSCRDVAEHLEHIDQQNRHDGENLQPTQNQGLSQPSVAGLRCKDDSAYKDERGYNTFHEHGPGVEYGPRRADAQSSFRAHWSPSERHRGESAVQRSLFDEVPPTPRLFRLENSESVPEPCTDSEGEGEDEDDFTAANPIDSSRFADERLTLDHQEHYNQSLGVLRDTNEYGGFGDVILDESNFVPQDSSTPTAGELLGIQRLRSQVALPRSPLFRSYGAHSPEIRPISCLTPHITSYRTPGSLLSQPARRPKYYRPRTISYSFDESERASTTHEELQESDHESNNSRPNREEPRSLREELYGESPQGISRAVDEPSPRPASVENSRVGSEASQVSEENRIFYFSSPRLPLPPPFSAVPRNRSLPASVPSASGQEPLSRSPSSSPPRSGVRGIQASPAYHSSTSPESPASSGILRNLASLPFRLLSAYRSRSPLQYHSDASDPESVSPTSQRMPVTQSPDECPRLSSAHGSFQIYDDRRPASTQPQTPQQLPEARHLSRLHPSYTAPAGPDMSGLRRRPLAISGHRVSRSDSPVGMEGPGFGGLYGGRENSDDDVMFNRAARRLWALSAARRSGRTTEDDTPGWDVTSTDA